MSHLKYFNPESSREAIIEKINIMQATLNQQTTLIKEYRKDIATLLEEHRKDIETLVDALNETRTQVQALLDYCFTDRSQWKEGVTQQNAIPNTNDHK